MKYLLDFDRTVFDMEGLYAAIDEQNPGVSLGTVESLEGIDVASLLFPDALAFFAHHSADDLEIISSGFGLTGQWEVAYQSKKIELSGVKQFVNAVHVVADSKISTIKRIAREHDELVYVDDHPENIADALAYIPGLQVVYINRNGTGESIAGAKTVSALSDLIEGSTI